MAKTWLIWITPVFIVSGLAVWTGNIDNRLGFSAIFSGWTLFIILVFLSLFNIRKKLPMLPLGQSSTWLLFHTVGGFMAMAVFWLHTNLIWPLGFYERALSILFYGASLSGILGLLIQNIFPRRLAQANLEVIYERIPAEIVELQEHAEGLLIACTKETGRDTLAQHYLETLYWFFKQPRFFWSHAFGARESTHWIRQQFANLEGYLNAQERVYLTKLVSLADSKRKIDLHYSLQTIMKSWLLIHIPLSAAVMALILWHMLLVHVYFL